VGVGDIIDPHKAVYQLFLAFGAAFVVFDAVVFDAVVFVAAVSVASAAVADAAEVSRAVRLSAARALPAAV
jgi:hypothetical protein